jgi:FAD/FMN-containing dehydrogenase
MTLRPATPEELAQALRAAHESRFRVERADLSRLNRILEHTPEDMTVTVEAGVTLAALQQALAHRGQWLPLDAPNPGRLTIAALLDTDASGPRRYGCGVIRDHLIGLRVALADGRLIRSGGKVVKNVAGYDLMKLFIGARGTLGVIVEATFKLQPLPEAEAFVQCRCETLDVAGMRISAVLDSELTPTVFDLHSVGLAGERTMTLLGGSVAVEASQAATANPLPLPARHERGEGKSGKDDPPLPGPLLPRREEREGAACLLLGFSGPSLAVDWQLALARKLGFAEPATLEYEADFHAPDQPAPQRLSVLSSRLVETLRVLDPKRFIARAGNGVILHRSAVPASENRAPARRELNDGQRAGQDIGAPSRKLLDLVKQTFDPNCIFPELPL